MSGSDLSADITQSKLACVLDRGAGDGGGVAKRQEPVDRGGVVFVLLVDHGDQDIGIEQESWRRG
ncbi:MAG TPA: hypothetical protein PKA24_17970, partial [Microthrixaceae bacterium]|nr:hypothetical protein [Microthrixaceae bacterium]